MKKKHLNIVLLILVCVIYGGVFSKLFGKKEIEFTETGVGITYNPQTYNLDLERNDFDINSIQNDPFKVNKKIKMVSPIAKKSTSSAIVKKRKAGNTWPRINYFGFVQNDVNAKKLALIQIQNKLYRKREGEEAKEVTLVKVYGDSIKVKFQNESKIILKQHE